MRFDLKQGSFATLRHRQGFIRNGRSFLVTPWRENLILDSGLNKVAAMAWANCFTTALWGDQVAPDPVRRDSAPITFTTVGNVCTASGAFFLASDNGRLIKFNDAGGQEFYLIYVSATICNLSAVPAPAIAGDTATIWYVNQTALQSPIVTGNTYGPNGGDNGTSFLANVATLKRTIIGAALGAPTTLTEIGFNSSAANVNIFDRDIIPGGLPLLAGDRPLTVVELSLAFSPTTPQAVGNTSTGFNSAGDTQLTCLATGLYGTGGIGMVNTAGVSVGFATELEPASDGFLGPVLANFSLPVFAALAVPGINPTLRTSGGIGPFTPGVWQIQNDSFFDISNANGTVYGFGTVSNACFAHLLTTPFVKANTQTLTLAMTKFWGRILIN